MKVDRSWAALALVAALPLACAGPRRASVAAPVATETAPAWRYAPLSWEKLESIEAWLNEVYDAPASLRVEGELELAEGRLVFAERERDDADPRVLAARLQRCERGFERVLDDPGASRDQRARAQTGRERLQGMRNAAPATVAPSALLARTTWRASPAVPSRLTPHRGAWSRITIHHSVSRPGGRSRDATSELLRSIQNNHMNSEGFGDIGYHFLVSPGGDVVEGRSLRWRGAHAGGRNNVANLGICLLGNFDTERPTREALAALERLTEELRGRYGIARKSVFGHKELKGTACPGTHLQRWVNAYRSGREPLAAAAASARPPSVPRGLPASVR